MENLIQGCHLMAGGIDLAAEGAVAMKGKVIIQLVLVRTAITPRSVRLPR
jgi:hypothetical protein